MDGILGALPQAQPQGQPPQMPGQAPAQMPGMQPRPAGPAPGINVQAPMLEKLGLDQLKQLYMQAMMPGSGVPVQPFAILSAINKKAEQEKAMQAVKNAAAMGQNAQQQGMGSVAQQVLQEADQFREPVMAAHGGMMRGYAGGGIVAFSNGDAVWKKRLVSLGVPTDFIANLEARKATPEQIETEARRAGYMAAQPAGVAPQFVPRSQEMEFRAAGASPEEVSGSPIETGVTQRNILSLLTPDVSGALTTARDIATGPDPEFYSRMDQNYDFGDELERIKRRQLASKIAVPATEVPERLKDARQIPAPSTRSLGAGTGATKTNVATVRADVPSERKTTALPKFDYSQQDREAQEARDKRIEELTKQQAVTPEVAAGRTGLESLVREEMEARKARLAQDRATAEQRRQEAIERAPGVFSPEGLLAIAASIDPRRGQEIGSAARGAFGVMSSQRKAQEEARKEFRDFEKAERTEQNLLSQMRILEEQRRLAIFENDATKANAITKEIYQVQQEFVKNRNDIEIKRRDAAAKELEAQARMTAAGKPTEFEFATQRPKEYEEYLTKKEKASAASRGVQERQELAELRALIASLRDQADPMKNFDKASREEAARLLKQAQERLASMSGLTQTNAPTGTAAPGTKENPIKLD